MVAGRRDFVGLARFADGKGEIEKLQQCETDDDVNEWHETPQSER